MDSRKLHSRVYSHIGTDFCYGSFCIWQNFATIENNVMSREGLFVLTNTHENQKHGCIVTQGFMVPVYGKKTTFFQNYTDMYLLVPTVKVTIW